MAPVPPKDADTPRVVVYYQTIHQRGKYISMMELARAGATHIIIAAVHLHADDPHRIHINDDPPNATKYDTMWKEKKQLEKEGVEFMCMLGGHAPGCYTKDTLDAPNRETFLKYYEPLRDMLRDYGFHGIDLDVEQAMTTPGIVRLVDQLRADFGKHFYITLTPVATALMGLPHMSGFDYFDLDEQRGDKISWYNVQFYNNWGNIESLDTILLLGWKPRKIVLGVLTSGENGSTRPPPFTDMKRAMDKAQDTYGQIGGVFGWEYFNSLPGGRERPWLWTEEIRKILPVGPPKEPTDPGSKAAGCNDPSRADEEGEAELPHNFEYDSDGIEGEA
ncbi:uncharacterized protein MKZ38_000627 [Zalerion maritima]|uniref:GH18 domain-containing protein n=1 Tax=Zalerion maritima TaxID=339359 RepID=A0AAD5RR92_9PEZI|nr:uncharacterized protein MKZ38_000627 [Zalerion maritima]